jgi:hypothetical protein
MKERQMSVRTNASCDAWRSIEVALFRILREYDAATKEHGTFNSAHEGFAVILEELDELKAEVWKKNRDVRVLAKEATQVGAMAMRFLVDVALPELEEEKQ